MIKPTCPKCGEPRTEIDKGVKKIHKCTNKKCNHESEETRYSINGK